MLFYMFLIELGIPFDLNILILHLGEGTLVFSWAFAFPSCPPPLPFCVNNEQVQKRPFLTCKIIVSRANVKLRCLLVTLPIKLVKLGMLGS